MSRVVRGLVYLWAFPGTLIGLFCLILAKLSGGQVRAIEGTLEVSGGFVTRILARLPIIRGASAMTLGHIIIGRDPIALDLCRRHEHVHVRQYERWGPFFIPAYLFSSLIAWLRGQNPYFDNAFERQAYAEESE